MQPAVPGYQTTFCPCISWVMVICVVSNLAVVDQAGHLCTSIYVDIAFLSVSGILMACREGARQSREVKEKRKTERYHTPTDSHTLCPRDPESPRQTRMKSSQ